MSTAVAKSVKKSCHEMNFTITNIVCYIESAAALCPFLFQYVYIFLRGRLLRYIACVSHLVNDRVVPNFITSATAVNQ